MEIKELTKKNGYLVAIVASYIAALLFLLFGLGTGMYHVMQHPAFLTDQQFFMEWLPQPGGIGAYLSLLVEQFFATAFFGGLLLVLEILLSAYLLVKLMERLFETKYGAKSLLWVVPLFVSIACINNVYFDFSAITRLMLMLLIMNLLHLLPKESKFLCILSAIAGIAIYHCCGPLYLYSFCAAELIAAILRKLKFIDIVGALAITALYPALMYRFVMPLTPAQVLYYPVVSRSILEQFQPLIALFFLLLPVSILVQYWVSKIKWAAAESSDRQKNRTPLFRRQSVCCMAVLAVLVGITVGIYCMNESRRDRFSARMAWEAENENWQYIINNAIKSPGYDRNTNFYYGLALAMKGQMASHLFEYPQLLGKEGLFIEEPLAGIVCYPSSLMYYQMGQISNSLRYSYESATYYRNSPYVMRRIVDCLIISKLFGLAEMFLKQLDRNMLAHDFVTDRRNYMAGKKGCDLSAEYVQNKQNRAVKIDYIMSPAYKNFEQLMLDDNKNYAAADYLLCYCLLNKDMDNFFNVLNVSNYNFKQLPKHYQEAVAIYLATTKNPRKEALAVTLDPAISSRFNNFMSVVQKEGGNAYNTVKQKFADTYWIYFAYENPMQRNNGK